MNASKYGVPALLAGFLTAQAAQADCLYTVFEGETALHSETGTSDVLGKEIPISGDFDLFEAQDLGLMMLFECLSGNPATIENLPRDKEFSPRNIDAVIPVSQLVQNLPLKFSFSDQSEFMEAHVTCEDITLDFDPEVFTKSSDEFYDAVKSLHGSVLNVLSAVHAQTQSSRNYAGNYSISSPLAAAEFEPDGQTQCISLMPSS